MKNRQRWFKLMFIAILMVAMGGMAQAAVFSPVGLTGYYADADAGVDVTTGNDFDSSEDSWNPNTAEADAEAGVGTYLDEDGWAYAYGVAGPSPEAYTDTINLDLYATATGFSTETTGYIAASASAQTITYLSPGTGSAFSIDPSIGENVGDPLQISFDFLLDIETGFGGYAQFKGDDGDHAFIYLNGTPIWTYALVDLDAVHSFSDDLSFAIDAFIGDTITVDMLVVAGIDFVAETPDKSANFAGSNATLTMTTVNNPVPIPGAIWLFGSGFLGLVGIRRKMKRV